MMQNSTKTIRSNIRTVAALAVIGIIIVLNVIISVVMVAVVESIGVVGDNCSMFDVIIGVLVAVGIDR